MKVDFQVLREMDERHIYTSGNTAHQALERNSRMKSYKSLASEQFLYAFEVIAGTDGHRNIHAINIHGLIYIIDIHTRKCVSILHARPSQLKRYWRQRDMRVPKRISQQASVNAMRNEQQQLNHK